MSDTPKNPTGDREAPTIEAPRGDSVETESHAAEERLEQRDVWISGTEEPEWDV